MSDHSDQEPEKSDDGSDVISENSSQSGELPELVAEDEDNESFYMFKGF